MAEALDALAAANQWNLAADSGPDIGAGADGSETLWRLAGPDRSFFVSSREEDKRKEEAAATDDSGSGGIPLEDSLLVDILMQVGDAGERGFDPSARQGGCKSCKCSSAVGIGLRSVTWEGGFGSLSCYQCLTITLCMTSCLPQADQLETEMRGQGVSGRGSVMGSERPSPSYSKVKKS
jgi:hypothetical protein